MDGTTKIEHAQILLNEECASLGAACAAAKMRLDKKAPESFQNSFQAYRGPKSFPDYFERKWLSLRLNAVKRGLVLNDDVTPETIQQITGEHCPVSLTMFSLSGQHPSNPSIDRLYNDGTYAVANLVVVTQRVNRAKADKSFEEIFELAFSKQDSDGLTAIEWARLTCLMYGAWNAYNGDRDPYLIPLSTYPSHRIFTSESQVVQLLLLKLCTDRNIETGSARWLDATRKSGQAEKLFQAFMVQLNKAVEEEEFAPSAWLHTDVFTSFAEWYLLSKPAITAMLQQLHLKFQREVSHHQLINTWAVGERNKANK